MHPLWDTISSPCVWDLEKGKPDSSDGEVALSAPGEGKQLLWSHYRVRGHPAISHSAIKGDLIKRQEAQEVGGLSARHVAAFGILSWHPARVLGAASPRRDGLAGWWSSGPTQAGMKAEGQVTLVSEGLGHDPGCQGQSETAGQERAAGSAPPVPSHTGESWQPDRSAPCRGGGAPTCGLSCSP